MGTQAELTPVAAAVATQDRQAASTSDFQQLLQKESTFSTRDLLAGNTLDKVMQLAEVMATSKVTVPKHLQGNVGDCAAIIGQAMRWGMDHNAVAQKTHLVNGTLGYEAQLVIAVLNSSPLLETRLDFQWSEGWAGLNGKQDNDPNHWCEVWATLRGESKPRRLRVSMAQVGGVRNSPNWASDARQQLAYLAAKRWGRLHAPDVILGVYTPDELQFGREEDPVAPPPPEPAALPAYPQGSFEKNLPAWSKTVASGKKSAADLLAMLSTKATFSAEQQAAVLELGAPEQEPTPPDAEDPFVAALGNDEEPEQ